MNTLMHRATELALTSFIANPSHGLLIVGPAGADKAGVADYVASSLLRAAQDELTANPNYLKLAPEAGSPIGIDDIRALKSRVSLKSVSSDGNMKRAMIILNADSMTAEAQNAVLKTLEEPQLGTTLILTAQDESRLLPTVRSRLQKITLRPVGLDQAKAHFVNTEDNELEKAWRLSGGHGGSMAKLLNGQQPETLDSIERAKDLVKAETYQRLLKINAYSNDTQQLGQDLESLDKLLRAGHHLALIKHDQAQADKFLNARRALRRTLNNLAFNANLKLNLTALFTELS